MNKRIIACAAAVLMAASVFSGCGSSGDGNGDTTDISINVITGGNETDGTPAEGNESSDALQEGTTAPVTEAVTQLYASAVTDSDGNVVTDDSGNEVTELIGTPVTDADGNAVTTVITTFVDPGAHLAPDAPSEETVDTQAAPDADQLANMITGNIDEKKPVITEYNVDHTKRYVYGTLSDAEKKLYDQILEAAKSLKIRLDVDDSVTDEMWVKVYGCVYMQEPQLFWLASRKVSKGKLWYWEVDESIISSMQKKVEEQAAVIIAKTQGKSDYEKLKVIHDTMVLDCEFLQETGYNQTVYGGLVDKAVQCEGYARTTQYLCDLAGIESMVVVGTTEAGVTHSWNVVKVDGKWYNLDCTWDDPLLSEPDKTNLRHRFFLVPDEWIHEKTHFNINKKVTGTQVKYFDPPACTSTDMNYYTVEGKLFSDNASADAALKEALKTSAAAKVRVAEIRAANQSVYDYINGNLKEYAKWIKAENSAVKSVATNCDPTTLVIELDLSY